MNTTPKAGAPAPIDSRTPPHCFWRTYPAYEFDEMRRLELTCLLGAFSRTVTTLRLALAGDAAAAVAVTLPMKAPEAISYPVDVAMSVLLNAALDGDAACALVLSNMLSRMPIEQRVRDRLAASWLENSARPTHAQRRNTSAACHGSQEDRL